MAERGAPSPGGFTSEAQRCTCQRVTHKGKRVTDKFFNRLKKHFSDEELVELAAVIALENFRSKFNPVFAVEANNFCPLPGVKEAAAAATRRFHE